MKTYMLILSTVLAFSCTHTQLHAAASDERSGIIASCQWLWTTFTGRSSNTTEPIKPTSSPSDYKKSKQLWNALRKQHIQISDLQQRQDIINILCSEGRDIHEELEDRKAYERAHKDPVARQRFELKANTIATQLVNTFKGEKVDRCFSINTHIYFTVDPKERITGTSLKTDTAGNIADVQAIPLLLWIHCDAFAHQIPSEIEPSVTFLKELMRVPENATFFQQLDDEPFPNCIPKETVAELQARITAQNQRAIDAIRVKYPDFYQKVLAQLKQ